MMTVMLTMNKLHVDSVPVVRSSATVDGLQVQLANNTAVSAVMYQATLV